MAVRTVRDVDLKDKRVFLRADFNVPISGSVVLDDFKIRSTLPTIRFVFSRSPRSVIIGSHLGRPRGRHCPEYSLKPVYDVLKRILKTELGLELMFSDLEETREISHPWTLLENLRFNKAEEDTDDCSATHEYRRFFRDNADIAIIDSFGCLHRECGSIQRTGLPSYMGLLTEKELSSAGSLLETDIDLLILGGKKVSDKIRLLSSLGKRTKDLFVVGGLAFPFLRYGLGREVCTGLSDRDVEEDVREVYNIGDEFKINIVLPVDFVVSDGGRVVAVEDIPPGSTGLDIGPKTVGMLEERILCAETIFWNGPPGVFEEEGFSEGTRALVRLLEDAGSRGKRCFCGGGETASSIRTFGSCCNFPYLSTGGGALMHLVSGRPLPGLVFLENQDK